MVRSTPIRRLPQRILMTGDAMGGVWTYVLELTRCLKQYGIEVDLATMGAPLTRTQQHEAAAIDNLTVHESVFKLEWMDDPWDDLDRAGEWLLGLEQILSPDLVHLNTYVHGVLSWQAPMLIVGHSCVLSWWQAVQGVAAPPSWEPYRRAVQRGLQAAAVVICPSRSMLNSLDRHYGNVIDGRVIFNGIKPAPFKATAVKMPYIFAAGRLWDEAKNIKALETVAPKLDWPIFIAGDINHPGGDKMHTRYLKLLGRLPSTEMNRWLSRAAIYSLPAFYEPFGLSILEAALSKCALVLGDIESLREIWGGHALFVKPNDLEELFFVLNNLINNEELRLHMARQARRRGLELDSSLMTKAYVDVYAELFEKKEINIHQAHQATLFH
jgi:glycogen synthase